VSEEVTRAVSTIDRVRAVVVPLLDDAGLELYDLHLDGGRLEVLVDRAGGADIDAIATVARAISRALDDADPIAGHYTLEVSSPGLERPLRTPAHYAAAVGTTVKVKTRPGTEGDRRVEGTITHADEHSVTITPTDGTSRTFGYADIERARTTFEWGPATAERK
jgi:ribosome maturation factor RimP